MDDPLYDQKNAFLAWQREQAQALLLLSQKSNYPKIDENYRKFLISIIKQKNNVFTQHKINLSKAQIKELELQDFFDKRKTMNDKHKPNHNERSLLQTPQLQTQFQTAVPNTAQHGLFNDDHGSRKRPPKNYMESPSSKNITTPILSNGSKSKFSNTESNFNKILTQTPQKMLPFEAYLKRNFDKAASRNTAAQEEKTYT